MDKKTADYMEQRVNIFKQTEERIAKLKRVMAQQKEAERLLLGTESKTYWFGGSGGEEPRLTERLKNCICKELDFQISELEKELEGI